MACTNIAVIGSAAGVAHSEECRRRIAENVRKDAEEDDKAMKRIAKYEAQSGRLAKLPRVAEETVTEEMLEGAPAVSSEMREIVEGNEMTGGQAQPVAEASPGVETDNSETAAWGEENFTTRCRKRAI